MTGQVLRNRIEGVVTLTLDNPESRNALTIPMAAQLCDMLREAASDASVRAVVLTGTGKAFCAGGDVKAMAAGRDANRTIEERADSLRDRAESVRLLHEMSKPTIALIPGPVAGAGLGLALACDFRLASSDAKLTTAFARVGLAGDFGVNWFMTRILGSGKARELMMFAPVLSAAEAHALGLLTRVFPAEGFAEAAGAVVAELAAGPTVAFAHIKQIINACASNPLAASLDIEALRQARCMSTDDHAGATRAFAEKRPPEFKGR
ncbi:MAG: enoyl-CoA hydratase-related protein [Betaproteobacteria bacterium]